MKDLLTPKQVARAIGASEASLKRWCDKGIVPSLRTAGGHRRIPLPGVLQFLRERGLPLVRPEVLGLPSATGKGEMTYERARSQMRTALESGDEEQFGRLVFDLYLGGHAAAEVCDKAIAPAFHDIGDRWHQGDLQVYEERRACEICLRVLHRLRDMLPPLPAAAPLAIGGTISGDPYMIPATMVEVALREAGWRAESYGTGNPLDTLCAALVRVRPALLWLSVSAFASAREFRDGFAILHSRAVELGIPVALGGRALTEEVRREIQYSAYCDTLAHLVSFSRTLRPGTSAKAGAGAAESTDS